MSGSIVPLLHDLGRFVAVSGCRNQAVVLELPLKSYSLLMAEVFKDKSFTPGDEVYMNTGSGTQIQIKCKYK